jgi:serpin B
MTKKLWVVGAFFLCALCAHSNPVPADDILAFVRSKLPGDPIRLTGTLKVRTSKGFTSAHLPVQMDLNWGADEPSATYRIDQETLEIFWDQGTPLYRFSDPGNSPTSNILDTGISWADLSFSVLWWPHSRLVKEEKKINRECHVVDVPIPGTSETMRLWIEKKMGMLLEAQTLDGRGKTVRRMRIKSIKKMDGLWVAKDLEVEDKKTGSKTILQITHLTWEDPQPAIPAFDPVDSVNQLSIDLYQQLSSQHDNNLFLSPYSISSALAMIYAGARGETAEQINQTLHFGGQDITHPAFSFLREKLTGIQEKGDIELRIANGLWPQANSTLLPDYLALIQNVYGSEIEPVDYQSDPEGSRQKINGWVEDKTNDRIKNIIKENMLSPATKLVLANAIYFKGDWARQFKAAATHPAPFTLADGATVEVPMMAQTHRFGLAEEADFQALELPYQGNDLSMLILLPNETDGLPNLEKAVSLEKLTSLEFHKQEVLVQLPKFTFESEFSLGRLLEEMGMPLAFSEQANLSGMNGKGGLFIDWMVHKAFVEVNEDGTEAAAATTGGIRATSIPAQFTANHPFLFLIRENSTDTILFIGRVMKPSI